MAIPAAPICTVCHYQAFYCLGYFFITFFRVKPYEVLNELAENDAIGTIYTTKNSPTLNDYMCTTTLNNVLEDGMDVDEALQDAQDYLDFECE